MVTAAEREKLIRLARVYLHQARAFGHRRSPFAFTLLEWAGNARRRAMGTAGRDDDETVMMACHAEGVTELRGQLTLF